MSDFFNDGSSFARNFLHEKLQPFPEPDVDTVPGVITPVISHTVAEMQALAAGNTLVAGQIYQITDAYGSTAVINIKAFSVSVLEDYGFGTFQNANMSTSIYCQMWYDLTGNTVKRIYEPLRKNDVSGGAINLLKFDANQDFLNNNTIINSNFPVFDMVPDDGLTFNDNFIENSQIAIYGNSSFQSNFIFNCSLDFSNSGDVYFTGNNFQNVQIISSNGFPENLQNCVFQNVSLDYSALLTSFAHTKKTYIPPFSNLEVTPTDDPNVNTNGGKLIDMTNFKWAGILKCDDATNDLEGFTAFPTDHEWRVVPFNVTLICNDHASLKTMVTAAVIPIVGTSGDWISFQMDPNDPTKVQTIIERIRS